MHDPEAGERLIVAPSLQFFRDEIMFWRTQKDKADREGAAVMRTMATQNIKGLQKIVVGRGAVEEMCLGSHYNTEEVGSWYARGVLLMANIRLMHEIIELPNLKLGSFASMIARNGLCVDFNEEDPGKSGLHVREEFISKRMRVEP